jgi:FkbM family methyltransferase
MIRFIRNAARATSNPRMGLSWLRWQLIRSMGGNPTRRLSPAGTIGRFSSFTDYWCFKPLPAVEYQFVRKFLPETGVSFDVGANVGMFAVTVGRAFRHATVHAFEPFPATFDILTRNVRANGLSNVVLHRTAVTSTSGTVAFTGSLHGTQINHVSPNIKVGIAVPACTLDEVARQQGVDHIDLLKIDAEGHEVQILKGAHHLLEI